MRILDARASEACVGQLKKVPAQNEMMCNKVGIIVVTSKSSFLPEKPNWRILRGYCRGDKPSGIYLCIYWARSPIR